MLSVVSSAAAGVASHLEDQAAYGRIAESRPLVEQLEAMVHVLAQQMDGLSIETLRTQAGRAGDPKRAV